MGTTSKIEWTDTTWNPILGCSRVSEGCRNCYAETIAGRFGRGKPTVYSGLTQIVNGRSVWTGEIKETKTLLAPLSWRPVQGGEPWPSGLKEQPATWTRSRRIFVNSMSDLFHENVIDEQRDRIFGVMALCPQHVFQVLTKRPKRMLEYLKTGELGIVRGAMIGKAAMDIMLARGGGPCLEWSGMPMPNVWLGVSVENQATADERIPLLLQTPAEVRFISAEPLLGPVVLPFGALNTGPGSSLQRDQQGWCDNGIDWVIAGGESGPHARPMHPDWARGLRDQCKAAGVPFFFKQWGEWGPGSVHITSGQQVFRVFDSFQQWVNKANTWVGAGICLDADGVNLKNGADFEAARYPVTIIHKVGKKKAGALLDGVEHHEFPGVPAMLVDEPAAKAGNRQG